MFFGASFHHVLGESYNSFHYRGQEKKISTHIPFPLPWAGKRRYTSAPF